jgi:uncharacterized protein
MSQSRFDRNTMTGVGLLIVQPTPFCNINCSYCYLADRSSVKRMSVDVLTTTIRKIVESGLASDRLSVVWHAGEPLTVPLSYYRSAFEAIRLLSYPTGALSHSIQTNGILIDDGWCTFFKDNQITIGVSVDGPDFIHDRHRKDRKGAGTHAKVMRGIQQLQAADIPFHAIAVVTAQSVDHPNEIFTFFKENGIRHVGFNIDELEGANTSSTLSGSAMEVKLGAFWRKIYELQRASNNAVIIREFERAYQAIALGSVRGGFNDQVRPLGIVSVDCDGNLSTFSPELLGAKGTRYGDFSFGNVMTHDFEDVLKNPRFIRVAQDIGSGVQQCADTCEFYSFCGGGAPSNKLFENGTFASSETMYCRQTVKMPMEIVLSDLEKSLDLR